MKALFLLTILASTTLGGCALTSKADALDIRWFNPETIEPRLTSADAAPRATTSSIELGRVYSGINLREKIAYRDAAHEVGYYDDKRWTERPEVYIRRELARTLFEERGIRRAVSGQAPALDVEVLSFEELRANHAARIQLRVVIHDDRDSLLEKTITVDRPIAKGAKDIDGLVAAMAEALRAVSEQVANEVVSATASRNVARP